MFILRASNFYLNCLIQTLTALDLSYDLLGDEAIQGLADILRNSKVKNFPLLSLSFQCLLVHIEFNHTRPLI